MTFVQQTLVAYRLDCPPDRLDVVVVVSNVRGVHIHPIAYAFAHLLPERLVFPHALFALFNERLDTVFFYFLFAVYAEKFFNFQLHGQTVRIPSRFAQNGISLHYFIARNNILHNARQNVSDVRLTVCRGRTVVKSKYLVGAVFRLGFFENFIFSPKL